MRYLRSTDLDVVRQLAAAACSRRRRRPHRASRTRSYVIPPIPAAARVRAYVIHPAGDLAPLAFAVRAWLSTRAVA